MENVADRHIVRLVCSMFSVLMGTFCLWLGILRTTPLYRTDSRYKFKRSNLIISSLSPAMKLEFHWNYSRLCVKSQHFRRKNLPPPSARQGTKMDDQFPDIKRRPLVFWGEGSILNFVKMATMVKQTSASKSWSNFGLGPLVFSCPKTLSIGKNRVVTSQNHEILTTASFQHRWQIIDQSHPVWASSP